MLLSVVIPSFNEEKTIGELIKRVLLEKTPKEIIIIDDGSTDKTFEKIKNLESQRNPDTGGKISNIKNTHSTSHSTLREEPSDSDSKSSGRANQKLKIFRFENNCGKGAAVRMGIEMATGDVLIIQDADLEYDPEDYQKLIVPIIKENADVVYGSRLREMKLKLWGKEKTPLPLHFLINKVLSGLTNLIYNSKVTDMETCYKMMTKKVYKNLALTSNRFEIEPEITAKIFKMGYKIAEVSIQTKPRNYKEGKKIKAKDAILAVWTLLRFAFIKIV